ncbi:MAG TPA: ribonuclease P protein component [Flavipsychrobacter sp.]|nr:ribonuclease P protein component [Flavipsychrobacter sp.]
MTQRNDHTPPVVRHTLKSYERLKRKKHIDTLFSMGKAYSVFPVTIKYLVVQPASEDSIPVLAGFSVSKKKFKHAVDRNRIKRLLREAWRLHKHELDFIPEEQQLHVFLIYTGKEIISFKEIESSVLKCIGKLKAVFE